jgi:hypothetical protein
MFASLIFIIPSSKLRLQIAVHLVKQHLGAAIAGVCEPYHLEKFFAAAPDVQPTQHAGAGNGRLQCDFDFCRRDRPSRKCRRRVTGSIALWWRESFLRERAFLTLGRVDCPTLPGIDNSVSHQRVGNRDHSIGVASEQRGPRCGRTPNRRRSTQRPANGRSAPLGAGRTPIARPFLGRPKSNLIAAP